MSGQWINCDGSGMTPTDRILPAWADGSVSEERRRAMMNRYGSCPVCNKVVALRSDGTVRVHVNSPEAKRIREQARSAAHERSVADLLKLRRELGA